MAGMGSAHWQSFVSSPRAILAGFLTLAAVLFIGLEPSVSPTISACQFLLALIVLGWVAILAYRTPQADTVRR